MNFLFLLVPKCYACCEAYWISNISGTYSSSDNLSEPMNAVSSLSYSVFGLVGIILKHNTTVYYLLMNLQILMGIASFCIIIFTVVLIGHMHLI